jgi:hypothetical protein
MSGLMNKNEGVLKAARGDTIPECNIHMNDVEVERLFMGNGSAPRSFGDRRKCTERHRKFPAIHPLAIKTGLKDMLIIAEATAAESTMKLLRGSVSFSVGYIRAITRTNRWRNVTQTMDDGPAKQLCPARETRAVGEQPDPKQEDPKQEAETAGEEP